MAHCRRNPLEPLRRAIYGMLPKNKLREQRMRRLRLFPDETHVHEANFQPGLPAFHVEFDQRDSPAVLTPIRPKETP
jgi:ribosomal protein L13